MPQTAPAIVVPLKMSPLHLRVCCRFFWAWTLARRGEGDHHDAVINRSLHSGRFMKLTSGSLCSALVLLSCWAVAASAQITFDRPKTEPPLPNPYTINVKRDQILTTIREVLKTCSILLDEEN